MRSKIRSFPLGIRARLDRKFTEDSSEKTYMSIVLKEVKRLERILDETLSFSKMRPLLRIFTT